MSELRHKFMSVQEVAARARVTARTVNRWVADGRLAPVMQLPGPTGARLFDADAVDAFLAEREVAS